MNTQDAIQVLEERMRDNPNSLLFARLADLYLQTGDFDKCVQICQDGIKAHPSYITAGFILSKAYLAKGDHDSAETELKKVLSHDMNHLGAHKLLGDLMARTGWENKAAIHYQDFLRIDPMAEDVCRMLNTVSYSETPPSEIVQTEVDTVESSKEASAESNPESWKEELETIIADSESDSGMLKDVDIFDKTPDSSSVDSLEKDTVAETDDFSFEFPDEKQTTPEIPSSPEPATPPESDAESFLFREDTSRESTPDILGEEDFLTAIQDDAGKAPSGADAVPNQKIPVTETPDEEMASLLFEDSPAAEDDTSDRHETPAAPDDSIDPTQPSKADTETAPVPEETMKRVEDAQDEDILIHKPEDDEGKQKIVSPTLGEIYAAQGQYAKAIRVYETLLEKSPEEKEKFENKIEELKKKLNE